MTDLLTPDSQPTDSSESATDPASPAAPQAWTATPLPPPPPTSLGDDAGRKRLLAIVAGLALAVAVVMALLWFAARSDRDAAVQDQRAAEAATAIETARADTADAELDEVRSELSQATIEAERLGATVATAEAEAAEAAARSEALDVEIDALATENVDLRGQIASLETELADAVEAADSAPEPAVADGVTPPAFDIDASPDFARFIGETISSQRRASVLGDSQQTCLGTTVVNDIGLDALGVGLADGAASSDSQFARDAIERAAISCGIDPSAVF